MARDERDPAKDIDRKNREAETEQPNAPSGTTKDTGTNKGGQPARDSE
jgi:hypothetical protein